MNARETLEKAVKVARGDIQKYWADLSKRDRDIAELGVRRVIAAGFTIMSKEDVEAVRDKALEEAAQVAESTPAYGDPVEISVGLDPVGERIASAIRSLKSGGDNGK